MLFWPGSGSALVVAVISSISWSVYWPNSASSLAFLAFLVGGVVSLVIFLFEKCGWVVLLLFAAFRIWKVTKAYESSKS